MRAAVRSGQPPRYERARRGSIVDAVEDAIRRELAACPRMPTTVIAERIGWTRGLSVLRARVRELRPVYQPPDPYQRTEYRPGEIGQWDVWFPPVRIPVEGGAPQILPVWVGELGYSRVSAAWMIPSRETHDVLEAHWRCLQQLGGVPRLSVYDGEGAIGQRRGPRVRLTDAFQGFTRRSASRPSEHDCGGGAVGGCGGRSYAMSEDRAYDGRHGLWRPVQ